MGERDEQAQDAQTRDEQTRDEQTRDERDRRGETGEAEGGGKPSRGYRIPGRSLEGASYGANEREQTAARELKDEQFRMDDGRTVGDAGQTHPRDES